MLQHFSQGNAMALCTKSRDIPKVLQQFSHDDFEEVRHLLSFRKLVEASPPAERITLLTDDDYFKKVLHKELMKLHEYLYTFHLFLRCLHIMVTDLPKNPLGRQVNDMIFSMACETNIYFSCEKYTQWPYRKTLSNRRNTFKVSNC